MEELSGVVISFDLKMSLLDIYFDGGSEKRSRAYSIIRIFLMSKGYEPLDDSDYKNNEHTINKAIDILKELCMIEKWFPLCVQKVIITPDSLYCDYLDIIKDEIDQDYRIKRESIYNEKTEN